MSRLPYLIASVTTALLVAQGAPTPAQYRSGPLPPVPTHAVGGGDVILEVLVSRSGSVSDVKVLSSAPLFADLMTTAVQGWRFHPAQQDGPVESAVLVAAVFRPPTINTPTLGSPSTTVAVSRPDVPFPIKRVTPPYPAQAVGDHVVLVEVQVGPSGNVAEAKAVGSAAGFDNIAVQAARGWVFRPAMSGGAPVASVAYILFGFREPITALNWPVGYFTTNPASYIRP